MYLSPISEPPPRSKVETIIGWREWLSLPDLNVAQIKAKVDTGARSSALHAFDIEYFNQDDCSMVHFKMHPLQRNTSFTVEATAAVLGKRPVRNSGGQTQDRPVIRTLVCLGGQQWPIELTLTNRDVMGFRMLLGREAIRHRFLVDSGDSYFLSPSDPFARRNAAIDLPNLS
ncbi:MAG: ATP-dependent zinc protease [Leptolyngbya sp. SIO1E4]|nr:ATP-dependent zinc protease [Leptolyngbya sp. SIO1E4]